MLKRIGRRVAVAGAAVGGTLAVWALTGATVAVEAAKFYPLHP